jgi:predicted nuclease of predicted toxin-antitoxin system
VAGRFAILTDENIDGPVTQGLKTQGWDVVLTLDVFGEESDDDVILQWAVDHDRVLVTSDTDLLATAHRWLREGRRFRMVYWHQGRHQRLRPGRIVEAFDELAKTDAFAACVEYLKILA